MTRSRRDFLFASTMASRAPLHAESTMPTRLLGSTGARVSALAFGCGSRFLAYGTLDKAIPALHRACHLRRYGLGLRQQPKRKLDWRGPRRPPG